MQLWRISRLLAFVLQLPQSRPRVALSMLLKPSQRDSLVLTQRAPQRAQLIPEALHIVLLK